MDQVSQFLPSRSVFDYLQDQFRRIDFARRRLDSAGGPALGRRECICSGEVARSVGSGNLHGRLDACVCLRLPLICCSVFLPLLCRSGHGSPWNCKFRYVHRGISDRLIQDRRPCFLAEAAFKMAFTLPPLFQVFPGDDADRRHAGPPSTKRRSRSQQQAPSALLWARQPCCSASTASPPAFWTKKRGEERPGEEKKNREGERERVRE